MIKRRGMMMVTVSLVLGLAAAWLANAWVQQRLGAATAAEDEGVRVVVAAAPIPFGTRVQNQHTRTVRLPTGTAPTDHFSAPEDVEGQIALQQVLTGEILLRPRFSEHGTGSTLAALIKPNMRAVTVRVNDVIGVAGFLLPGNRVDVLGTRMVDRRAVTETILRDLNVLAVDQRARPDREEPVLVRAVTLEMTPGQAETLVKAREEGSIQLALRNPLEVEPEPVVAEAAPAPTPPPAPRRAAPRPPPNPTITVIRGTHVDTTRTGG